MRLPFLIIWINFAELNILSNHIMHNQKRHFRPLMSLLFLLIAGSAAIILPATIQAQQVLVTAVLSKGQTGFKITQNGNNGFHFINRLAALDVYEEGTTKGLFSVIGVEGYASTQVAGDPAHFQF